MKKFRNQHIPLSYILEETIGDFSLFEVEAERKENKKYFIRGFISVLLVAVITSINFI